MKIRPATRLGSNAPARDGYPTSVSPSVPRPRLVVAATVAVLLGLGLGFGPGAPRVRPCPVAGARVASAMPAPADSLACALGRAAPDLDRHVLALALTAQAAAARQGLVPNPSLLTVIDYSRPSVARRFFVFDLVSRTLVCAELVAHGRNSGDNMATRFSNAEASLETSLGLFVTGDTYVGEHGRALRLAGLEPGFNDRALARGIVIHGADYVSPEAVARLGRLGRSWGCPALPPAAVERVIDRIRGGSAVFAYYPESRWLATSHFLRG